MTPAQDLGQRGESGAMAVPEALRFRRDFLAAARARRQPADGFLLQARQRGPDEPNGTTVRFGLTCSRKVGNAVVRNRARRRLRALARALLAVHGRPGWDYVLVGRPGVTVARPMPVLEDDLRRALERVHRPPAARK